MTTLAYELSQRGVQLANLKNRPADWRLEVRWADADRSGGWQLDCEHLEYSPGLVPVLVVGDAWDDNTGYRDAALSSNYRWFIGNVEEDYRALTGGWAGDSITLWLGEYEEDMAAYLADVIVGLADYPIIDEDLMVEVEEEFREKSWDFSLEREMGQDVAIKLGHDGSRDFSNEVTGHSKFRTWVDDSMSVNNIYGHLEYEDLVFNKADWATMVAYVADKFAATLTD